MQVNRVENPVEGFQFSFDSIIPGTSRVSKKPVLSREQRIAIEVKALKSGLNQPLTWIIKGIKANHEEGGTDTTMLWYRHADGTKGLIEATCSELEDILQREITASKSNSPRRKRFKGL